MKCVEGIGAPIAIRAKQMHQEEKTADLRTDAKFIPKSPKRYIKV